MSDTAPSAEDNHAPSNGDRTETASDDSNARSFAVVRYGLMGHIGEFSHDLDPPPGQGEKVVIRTERGVELGEVVAPVDAGDDVHSVGREKLENYLAIAGSDYPFKRGGKILRKANQQDIIDQRHLNDSAGEEAAFCRDQIRRLNLAMKLVAVEHLLGGERIIFYFSSETRVDFRELVRRLAGQYRTRIEMRQVGARDEARLVGDYERCGRQCCCRQFLKHLQPVAMKMAKLQKATLDPSKISGRCGRLMCCLRFEDAGYEELRKRLPRRNIWVRTEQLVGRVIDTQILTQLVMLQTPDGTQVAVGNEDIVERNVEPPKPGESPAPRGRGRERAKPASKPEPATEPTGGDNGDGDGQTTDKKPQPDEQAGKDAGDQARQSDGEGESGKSSGRRRRRGGRKRRSKSKSKGRPGSGKKSGGSRRSRGKGKGKRKGGGKN
ncbi:MAG: PSP1 domain-containing protein [Phycisphaerae bacterium]